MRLYAFVNSKANIDSAGQSPSRFTRRTTPLPENAERFGELSQRVETKPLCKNWVTSHSFLFKAQRALHFLFKSHTVVVLWGKRCMPQRAMLICRRDA